MKKLIFLSIILIILSSCFKQELSFNENKIIPKQEKTEVKIGNKRTFVIIPHHNLANNYINDFYKNLKNKYKYFDNIVIISPNHYTNENYSFTKDGKYCYKTTKLNCINGKELSFGTGNLISTFTKQDDFIITKEHGIGNHFGFIDKYFSSSNIYTIGLKINTKQDNYLDNIQKKIVEYNFTGKTLFIASVDFSHHVNEKIAVFHDLKTLDFLNSGNYSDLEVDCPNCLLLQKKLADNDNKKNFNLYNRTSVDKLLSINSNYNNTTHIYGEFEEEKIPFNENIFSGSYLSSKFDLSNSGTINENEVYGMFFGDTHFTRGFTYKDNLYDIKDYLQCFYSNKNKNNIPKYWHNRMFYSFDYVGVNLETSVGNENECQKSSKSIVFRTEPKYLENFKDIGINLFDIANNHTYDCGNIGFESTKSYLNEKGLYYYGDGRKTEENILKKEINGTKIAFIGINDIASIFDKNKKLEEIKQLTNSGYLVIINIHWGNEYNLNSNLKQQNLAKDFIDSGAKLIIGHHPHVVQEYNIYKGVPIFYSLGNFIFDQPFEDTITGYGIVFAINNFGIKYNIIEFKRNSKNYMLDCDSFN